MTEKLLVIRNRTARTIYDLNEVDSVRVHDLQGMHGGSNGSATTWFGRTDIAVVAKVEYVA